MSWKRDIMGQSVEDELLSKKVTVLKLTRSINKLKQEADKASMLILTLKADIAAIKETIEPTKKSLDSMTAAYGKLLRKIKRQGSK